MDNLGGRFPSDRHGKIVRNDRAYDKNLWIKPK